MPKDYKGWTLYFVWGKHGGYHFETSRMKYVVCRIGLGRLAICLLRVDMECLLDDVSKAIDYMEGKVCKQTGT